MTSVKTVSIPNIKKIELRFNNRISGLYTIMSNMLVKLFQIFRYYPLKIIFNSIKMMYSIGNGYYSKTFSLFMLSYKYT